DTCNQLGEKAKKADLFHAINMEKETVEPTTPLLDPTLFKGGWCYAEQRHGKLMRRIYELLFIGRKLADDLKEELSAVLIGNKVTDAAQDLIDHGADQVSVMDDQ